MDVSVALRLISNADFSVGSLEFICRAARDFNGHGLKRRKSRST